MKFFVKIFLIEAMDDVGPYQPKYEQGDEGEKGIWCGAILLTSPSAGTLSEDKAMMSGH